MNPLEFINLICPEHERTSCNDKDLNNGFYSGTHNTRCARCTLLQILKENNLPKSHTFVITCNIEKVKKCTCKKPHNNWITSNTKPYVCLRCGVNYDN